VERVVRRCGRDVNGSAATETWAVAAEDVFLRLGSTRPSWSRRRCRCWRTPRGGADWCSAPHLVAWRAAQYWQRRVGGVAPADDKVGTRRGGDVTTPHRRGGTRPAALPTRRCGRRCGDRDVGGRRRGRLPPPRIDSAVVVTAAMPVLAYPTRGTLIGAQRLPPWGGGTPSTGSVASGAWPRRTTRSGRDGVATLQQRIGQVECGEAALARRHAARKPEVFVAGGPTPCSRSST